MLRSLAFVLLVLAVGPSCMRPNPIVSVEAGDAERGRARDCPNMPLPEYPPNAIGEKIPTTTVRVDFVIDRSGAIRDVTAAALQQSPLAALFERAAARAVYEWSCRPAAPPHRTWVRFRFEPR